MSVEQSKSEAPRFWRWSWLTLLSVAVFCVSGFEPSCFANTLSVLWDLEFFQ